MASRDRTFPACLIQLRARSPLVSGSWEKNTRTRHPEIIFNSRSSSSHASRQRRANGICVPNRRCLSDSKMSPNKRACAWRIGSRGDCISVRFLLLYLSRTHCRVSEGWLGSEGFRSRPPLCLSPRTPPSLGGTPATTRWQGEGRTTTSTALVVLDAKLVERRARHEKRTWPPAVP